MPSELLERLDLAGVESISTIAANWRYVAPEDTVDAVGERKELADFRDIYLLSLQTDSETCDAIEALTDSPYILVAQCDRILTPFSFPTDPPDDLDYWRQWHLDNFGQNVNGSLCDPYIDLNAPEAWQISHLAGSPIAIVDDGITREPTPPNGSNHDNPDVTPFVAPYPISKSFATTDPSDWGGGGHGTGTAGVAAARGNNGVLVAGVANIAAADPQPMLVSLRVVCQPCGFSGDWTATRVSQALSHLASYPNVRISNHSYGDGGWKNCWDDLTLRTAFRNAYFSNNCLSVASGNGASCSGTPCNPFGPDSCISFPAGYDDFCLSVTAVDCHGASASPGQEIGSNIDLACPGGAQGTIWTTHVGGGATSSFGQTSAAAPMAAGTASLMLGINPNLTNDDIYGILKHSTVSLAPYGHGPVSVGNGLLKADLALTYLTWPYKVTSGTITDLAATTTTDLGEDILTLRNIPGTGAAPEAWISYRVRRYRVVWTGMLKKPLAVPLTWTFAWNRGRSTFGAPDIGPGVAKKYDHLANAGHADVLSVSPSGLASFETYTYKVMDAATGQFLCWYPFKPNVTDFDVCASSQPFRISYGAVYRVLDAPNGESSPLAPPLVSLDAVPVFTRDDRIVVQLSLEEEVRVTAAVHDVAGRVIARLCEGQLIPAGRCELSWPISNTIETRGIFFVALEAEPVGGSTSRWVRKVLIGSR
ncbi:MAG: S8 family serine peptidase [Candidatus Eisenbacteria bacterium]|nr:S8 family serine peptidase [Candidatus Eisenbacteria bacterium]